jgi:hypothetical protein
LGGRSVSRLMISPRLTIELTPEEEIVLLRNEARFDYCTWEESDEPEEINENTFKDAYVEGVQEASAIRVLAQCRSAEDAELVLAMFNILQRAVQETGLR